MTNINPIRFGITGNNYNKPEKKDEYKQNNAPEKHTGEAARKQLSSKDVLGFLAAQNADFVPVKAQKTVNVKNYVSAEQEARIANFMKGFEADFDEAFNVAANEFPELSKDAASELALAYINATY